MADKDTKIYPNPCHDELYINKLNNENNCDYDVYSIAGEKLISLDDFGGDVIDVNPLAPGSYIWYLPIPSRGIDLLLRSLKNKP